MNALLDLCREHRLISASGEPAVWFARSLRDEVEEFTPNRTWTKEVQVPAEPAYDPGFTRREWKRQVSIWCESVRHAFDQAGKSAIGSTREGRLKDLLDRQPSELRFAWETGHRVRKSRAKEPNTERLAKFFLGKIKTERAARKAASEAARVRRLCRKLGLRSPLRVGRPPKGAR